MNAKISRLTLFLNMLSYAKFSSKHNPNERSSASNILVIVMIIYPIGGTHAPNESWEVDPERRVYRQGS